jgi:hypothetical protein
MPQSPIKKYESPSELAHSSLGELWKTRLRLGESRLEGLRVVVAA